MMTSLEFGTLASCRDRLEARARRANRKAFQEMADPARRWFVAEVASTKEFVTQHILSQHGVSAFLSLRAEWRRVNRITKDRKRVLRPLVPRYLFISFALEEEENWLRLFDANLIRSVVGVGGVPQAVDGVILQRFAHKHGMRVGEASQRPVQTFQTGDVVRMPESAFRDQRLVVRSVSGDAAEVLASILGAKRTVNVSTREMERAD